MFPFSLLRFSSCRKAILRKFSVLWIANVLLPLPVLHYLYALAKGANLILISFILCSRKLQPLVDYVLSLGKSLQKKSASAGIDSEISGLARRLKKMLVELNEYDNAREIVRTFHLKEAL